MSQLRPVGLAVKLPMLPLSCSAADQLVIPEALQQEPMRCVGEAVQACPEVWTGPDHGLV